MKQYHYTECGLDNIYLLNGFKITKTKHGEEIFINNIHGLHKAIGLMLISKHTPLSAKEIKFIRTTMDLSQTTFAKLLGLSYQTILFWEKDKAAITKTADYLLRAIFLGYLDIEKSKFIYDKINEIAELDADKIKNKKIEKVEFEAVSDKWKMAV